MDPCPGQYSTTSLRPHWTSHEKVVHLLAILQGQAVDILHSVSAEATYKDIIWALKGHYGDHQQAAAYWSQLKARIQMNSRSLHESAVVVKQMAH
jgi:hypothetical protein